MKLKTANLQHEKKICWVLVRRLQKREIFYNIIPPSSWVYLRRPFSESETAVNIHQQNNNLRAN